MRTEAPNDGWSDASAIRDLPPRSRRDDTLNSQCAEPALDVIEVRLYGPFRDATGETSIDVEPERDATVGSTLRTLCATYPGVEGRLFDEYGLRDSINVTKDGINVRLLDGAETPVADGDRISVTGALEGG